MSTIDISSSVITRHANSIAFNGKMVVTVGSVSPIISTSIDHGTTWVEPANTSSLLGGNGKSVIWTGTKWLASGTNTDNTIGYTAYSYDGDTWYAGSVDETNFFISKLAGNSYIGTGPPVDSQLTLNKYGVSGTTKLDVVSDSYNNDGFTNMTLSIKSSNL